MQGPASGGDTQESETPSTPPVHGQYPSPSRLPHGGLGCLELCRLGSSCWAFEVLSHPDLEEEDALVVKAAGSQVLEVRGCSLTRLQIFDVRRRARPRLHAALHARP